jgi:preprotein translocase SecE subunit
MDDVIKHLFFYRIKRWFFGLNKEFSRVSWWNKKHVFMDFAIIIIIVGLLALIFMGIDMAYLKA